LAQINGQITARTNRQTLIQAVLNGLDAVVTELVALDADGYPALLATSVVGSIFSELQEENADLDAAVAIGIAAEQRAISLLRGFIGQAAAVCPWLTWNALPFPYGNDAGMQSIREIQYDLTQLGGENAAIVLTNSADINPMGATSMPMAPPRAAITGMPTRLICQNSVSVQQLWRPAPSWRRAGATRYPHSRPG
jgi:hypothetical protein